MDESEDQGQEMVKDKDAEQDNEIKTPFHGKKHPIYAKWY